MRFVLLLCFLFWALVLFCFGVVFLLCVLFFVVDLFWVLYCCVFII